MGGGWELSHIQADLGDDDLGGTRPDAGDLAEAVEHRETGASFRRCLCLWELSDQLVDACGQLVDLGRESVDLLKEHLRGPRKTEPSDM